MILDLLLVAGGVAALALSGARLVDFAAAIAEKARLTPAVIGLTVVAAGTPPRAFRLGHAAVGGSPEIALGNVVGSNICNLLTILGATGLLRPIPVEPRMVELDMVVMLGFGALMFALVARDRALTRRDGALLGALRNLCDAAPRHALKGWAAERGPRTKKGRPQRGRPIGRESRLPV